METPQEERYWSRFASSYDRDGEYVVGGRILEAITLKLSQEQPLGRTVEFGCGTGYFTVAIAGNARQVVATDLSDTMLETARARLRECTNVTIRQAGCAGTSFAPGSFDSVVMINLLHVIEDPSRCLQESHRILRKGGTLIAADLTGHGMKIVHKLMLGLRYLWKWGPPPRRGRHALFAEQLVGLAESAGFTVSKVELLKEKAHALYLRAEKI